MHDGLEREYTLYIPSSYDETEPVPLMLNFHGFNGTAAGHMVYGDMRPEADADGFILVYPQGSLLNGVSHWNVGSWTAASTADDVGFTAAMIDAIASAYTIDENRVYSTGYSNGGYFSFELACRLSARIAAIGPVAGSMSSETYDACNPTHPTPVLQIHGTADQAVLYEGGTPVGTRSIADVLNYWTSYNGTDSEPSIVDLPDLNDADGSTVEYYSYDNGDAGTSVDHYRIEGGGHDWPDVDGNPAQVNVDISASSAVWEFVSQYDLNGLIGQTGLAGEATARDHVRAFPNPTSGVLVVESRSFTDASYTVSTVLGKVVLRGSIAPGRATIDLARLAPGLYFLQIENRMTKIVKL